MIEWLRRLIEFPVILVEVFAEEFYWIGKFFFRISWKVWHGSPMNSRTIEEADREVTGEKQRRDRWRESESQERLRRADANLEQLRDPRHWAWSLKNLYAKRGIELDLEEMVRIISPLGDEFCPSPEQHEKLLDYIFQKESEALKSEVTSP